MLLFIYLGPQGALSSFGKEEKVSLPGGVGKPVRLKIPKINVDASVVYVGLTPQGAMGAPKTQDDVAWYQPGVRPGEKGSAVIAGHYGWIQGRASVFNDISALRKGDKIYVEDDRGAATAFVVREIRTYDPKADTATVFGSTDGKSHLNLITCEGVWDAGRKTYSERLVVFADKE
ncbi:MAG: class F sortase [bacterium]|nr:class F sortase [bacterium]